MVEHRAFNPMVQGSSPWRPTIDFKGLRDLLVCFDFSRGRIGLAWLDTLDGQDSGLGKSSIEPL